MTVQLGLAALALALALPAGAAQTGKPAPKSTPQPPTAGGAGQGARQPPEEARRAAEAAAHPFDSFGTIPCGDELARIDNLVNEMEAGPELTAYIVAYGPRGRRNRHLRPRLLRMQAYMVNRRGVPRSRIVAVDAGRGDELKFFVFLRLRGAQPPVDEATLRAGRVSLPTRGRRVADCEDSYDIILNASAAAE